MTQHLWTPWRMSYIKGEKKPVEGCVFCDKRDSSNDGLDFIVARSEYVYVVLNIYPYNNGHVMVVPYDHIHSQEDLHHDALVDLTVTTNRTLAALRKVYNPPAFNLGANIGAAAGAGIAAHYHFHIVPRWAGDANFMTIVGETRVIPDTLENIYRDLKTAWTALYG
jgi:ATP adenylyltransferase